MKGKADVKHLDGGSERGVEREGEERGGEKG